MLFVRFFNSYFLATQVDYLASKCNLSPTICHYVDSSVSGSVTLSPSLPSLMLSMSSTVPLQMVPVVRLEEEWELRIVMVGCGFTFLTHHPMDL